MKISFIEPHLEQYGGIRRIIEISNRLVCRGHDVTIFHSNGTPCQWMENKSKTKPVEAVLSESHDVLIFNHPALKDITFAIKAKAKLKMKYVLELWDKDVLIGFNLNIYKPRMLKMFIMKKMLYSPFTKLTNATWEQEWLQNKLRIPSYLLIGGVNRNHFYILPRKKPDKSKIRILCSGDPRKRKGTETIKSAFEIVKSTYPNVVLDTYHGQGIAQKEMGEKYSSADIFVEASFQAGWNNPVAEAMACGVPVVCTDIGGVKDFAFNRETAILVPVNDPKSLADAVFELIENKELRNTLKNNALEHVRRFDWDKCVDELEAIIEKEMHKKRGFLFKLYNVTYSYSTLLQLYFINNVFHKLVKRIRGI